MGHLFVVQGDVTRIHADAWLLPTDERRTGDNRYEHRRPRAGRSRVVHAGVEEALVVAGNHGALRVCLPVIATGEGGKRGAKGQVLEPLVLGLNDVATRGSIDVVLVAREAASFAAARRSGEQIRVVTGPDQTDAALAERLAGHAREGRLVLFLGAGIGREVGLPVGTPSCASWPKLWAATWKDSMNSRLWTERGFWRPDSVLMLCAKELSTDSAA